MDRKIIGIDIGGVESDQECTRLDFKIPVDQGEVNLEDMNLYINYRNANGDEDVYIVDDATTDGTYVSFTWLLSRLATAKAGKTFFVVCAKTVDSDGNITAEWNTERAYFNVLGGLETSSAVVEEESDAIAYLTTYKQNVLTAGDGISIDDDVISCTASVTIDTEMSDSSTNAVQNSTIKAYVDDVADTKQDVLTAGDNITITDSTISATDTTYTAGDNITIENNVISATSETIDTAMSDSSTNAVQNMIIKTYVDDIADTKQDTLTFDSVVDSTTATSTNPSTTQAIYNAIQNIQTIPYIELDLSEGTTASNQIIASEVLTEDGLYRVTAEGRMGYEQGRRANGYLFPEGSLLFVNTSDEAFLYLVNGYSGWVLYTDSSDTWAIEDNRYNSYINGIDFEGVLANYTDTEMSDSSIYPIANKYAKAYIDTKQDANLTFSDISVSSSDWTADTTYSGYSYKAVLSCSGVTEDMVANVYLSSASASLGTVASFWDEGTDSVTIYSSTNDAISIKKVVVIQ